MLNSLFKRSLELNQKIEKYLDTISRSLMLFEQTMNYFLEKDLIKYKKNLKEIETLESKADTLESDIKVMLYKYMLIPDVRADVLSLIKSLDNIIDLIESITKNFYIQKPDFPNELTDDMKELTKNSLNSADELLNASRAFFNEVHLVNKYINKVIFYEQAVDKLEYHINNSIFNKDLVKELSHKLQLKYFVSKIAKISDEAELISEKITIFSIKREI